LILNQRDLQTRSILRSMDKDLASGSRLITKFRFDPPHPHEIQIIY
jgi:hypothetical protein